MKENLLHIIQTRRELLERMGTGLATLTVSSAWGQIRPAEARAKGAKLRTLSAREADTLEALGDVLLPGASDAGIAHFIDDQLNSSTPLLVLRYLDFPSTFREFYRRGLAALDKTSRSRHGRSFRNLNANQKNDLVREISTGNPPEWNGPPAPLFYFVLRNDAVDVVYGTEEGFAKLDVPYLAHISPSSKW